MYNERTLRMMESYVRLFNEGMTLTEIAKEFRLAPATVRLHLGEIAEKEGVTRESLLNQPHREHIMIGAKDYEPVKPLDVTEFSNNLEVLNKEFDKTIKKMEERIESLDTKLKEEVEEWK